MAQPAIVRRFPSFMRTATYKRKKHQNLENNSGGSILGHDKIHIIYPNFVSKIPEILNHDRDMISQE